MELSGAEDGKITDGDTQGGWTGGNGSGRMETVEGQTNIPSWQEEIVGFQSGKLERFMKENDMEQRLEYTVRDIMHVFRNVIEQRDLCKKTNTLCVLFDAELKSILGMRSSYGEEFKKRVEKMTTPMG